MSELPPGGVRERLHRAWLWRLRQEWADVNDSRLGGALRPPQLIIDDGRVRLGRWSSSRRLLGIAERHIWRDPWEQVLDTLRHEMAHQYADEVLGAGDERPHGPAFAHACEQLGIEARASGRTEGLSTARADRVLTKVRKLLALASSANVHEAEAAMAAANTLLLRYNLELPRGDRHPGYAARRVGRAMAAIPLHHKQIANLLDRFFFVECIWVGRYNARRDRMERVLELCGTPANLDFAAYVHDFLHRECDRLWRVHGRAAGGGRSRKREFVCGVLEGLSAKLQVERDHNQERGLVWVGDPGLGAYFGDRHPRVGKLSSGGVRMSGAYEEGERRGRELTIRKPLRERRGNGGRLLPGGRG